MSNGLRTYFSLHPSGVPRTGPSNTKQPGIKKLPTPSFLVPAVLEALCASEKYAPVTKLVPGEADIFCARHVHSSRGMIITSDSDLLAHDLGREGSVTFFPSIQFDSHARKVKATVSEYSPWRICERLSIPHEKGLSPIAFQVSIDPQVSLQRAIQLAKQQANSETSVPEHAAFVGQYLSPEIMEDVSLAPISGRLLDPRISELMLKFLLSDRTDAVEAEDSANQDKLEVPMYLPFLADSPSRTSAWEVSVPLRRLAYRIGTLLTTKPISSVLEYRRLQTFPGGTRVEIPPATLDQLCVELVGNLGKIRACVTDPRLQWTMLAISQEIKWSEEHGKSSTLSLDMLQAEANGTLDVGSWDFVHLHAEVQGAYYSLRMIQQVCEFVSRDHSPSDNLARLQTEIGCLSLHDGLPSISDFATLFGMIRASVSLSKLVMTLELGEEVAGKVQSIINPKEKKRKRQARSDGQKDSPVKTGRPSNNPFELLGGG